MKVLRNEHGQQFVLVASLLPFLIAFLGLVVDVGAVFVHQRMVQNAADAAASAAGMVLYPQGRTAAINTATFYATQNGYTDNGTDVRVIISQPPTSGAFAGNARYIQVEVREQVPPIFAAVVWNGTFTVRARATAGYTVQDLGADLYVLKDTTTCDGYVSLYMNGNPALIKTPNGMVQVNSPCNNAVSVGNGDILARAINIVGPGYSRKPNSIFTPPARLNAPVIPDPLANLPAPSTTGCVNRTGPVDGKYLPGVYASGFSPNYSYPFDGSGGACNGVFYFQGGLNPGNATVTLNQGMFYLATGGMVLGGNGAFNATSPASGPYAGLVIFMARGNSSTVWMHGTVDADSCTAATATVKGIAYLPAGTLDITGNSNDCFATALIVWKLSNNGTTETTLVAYPGQKPPTTVTDSQVE